MKANLLLTFLAWIALGTSVFSAAKSPEEAQKIEQSLQFRTGEFPLAGNIAKLKVPQGFTYLDKADAKKVLTDLWGNPESPTQGMIFPADKSYSVVIEGFAEEGYVKDDDADKIDAAALLKQIQEAQKEDNEERKKQGSGELEVVGWALPPHYDKEAKKLYFALDLKVAGETEHGLNYRVRILGRKGYMVINALGTLSQLKQIEAATPQVLSMIEFSDGNKYADFNSKTDKVAAYGIAGLIIGAVGLKLAKLGIFALLLKKFGVVLLFLKKGLILVVAAFAALFNKIKSFFTGRSVKAGSEPGPPPQP